MAKKNEYSVIAKLLLIPVLNGVQFTPSRDQLSWYSKEVGGNIYGLQQLFLGYEQRPSFQYNYQRDKFLANRDIILCNYGDGVTPILRKKRHSDTVTVYDNKHFNKDLLAKALEEEGYEVTVEDNYPDEYIDSSTSKSGASHYEV